MNIYTITFLLSVLFAFVEFLTINDRKFALINWVNLLIIFVIMFFIAGFREVGFDYNSYEEIFNTISYAKGNWLIGGLSIGMEPGFAFINYISSNYQMLIAVMSALSLSMLYKTLSKHTKLPLASVMMYLGLFFLSGIMGQQRQAIAVIIGIYAMMNIDNKKVFYLTVIAAMSFHASAILILIANFIPRDYKSFRFYSIAIFAAIISGFIAHSAYLKIITYFPSFISQKLISYATQETESIGLNATIFLRLILFFIYYNYREKLRKIAYMPLVLNCYFLSILIYIGLNFAPQVAGRGGIYLASLEILLSSNVIYVSDRRYKPFIFIFFAAIAAYRLINFLNNPIQGAANIDFLPYRNWLF